LVALACLLTGHPSLAQGFPSTDNNFPSCYANTLTDCDLASTRIGARNEVQEVAENYTTLGAPAQPAPPQGRSPSTDDLAPLAWQAGINYSYVGFDLASGGIRRSYNGVSATVSRYADNDGWWGIEGYINFTGGSIASDINRDDGPHVINNSASSVTAIQTVFGGGPRFAYRKKKFEPWAHLIFAGDLFKFSGVSVQVAAGETLTVSSYTGFSIVAGGGVDYKINRRFAIRGGVDSISSRVREAWYQSVSAGGGLVISF